MNAKTHLLITFVTILFNTSCNNKLSRKNAEEQIIEKLGLPFKEKKTIEIADGTIYSHLTENKLKKYENAGLLKIKQENVGMSIRLRGGRNRPNGIRGYLTPEGKKYAASEPRKIVYSNTEEIDVYVATLHFDEITGIITNTENNTAQVEYTLIRKDITPFGRTGYNLVAGKKINQSANFTKYDDGWRIE